MPKLGISGLGDHHGFIAIRVLTNECLCRARILAWKLTPIYQRHFIVCEWSHNLRNIVIATWHGVLREEQHEITSALAKHRIARTTVIEILAIDDDQFHPRDGA